MYIIQYFYSHPLNVQKSESSDTEASALNESIKHSCSSPLQIKPPCPSDNNISESFEKSDGEHPILMKRNCPELSLDEKIDAIIESTKRKCKKVKYELKYKRNRKSKDQIKILTDEFMKGSTIANERLNELANETGLSKIQVYKWYWDYKTKKMKI